MREINVVSVRSARDPLPRVQPSARAELDAVYGCVDWYLYEAPPVAACAPATSPLRPEKPAPESLSMPGAEPLLAV